jgi:DNA/RNA endonuclease YhcR with UshA esterase domain
MQEKTITKISFIVAIIGLSFLFLFSEELDLSVMQDINVANLEEEVKIRGSISSLRTTEKATFMEIEGEKIVKTDIIFFPGEKVNLKEGDYVELYGEVEEYKGEKEVIASKVVLK